MDKVDNRVDEVDKKVDKMYKKVDKVDKKVDEVDTDFASIWRPSVVDLATFSRGFWSNPHHRRSRRVDKVDNQVDKKVDKVDKNVDKVDRDFASLWRRMVEKR